MRGFGMAGAGATGGGSSGPAVDQEARDAAAEALAAATAAANEEHVDQIARDAAAEALAAAQSGGGSGGGAVGPLLCGVLGDSNGAVPVFPDGFGMSAASYLRADAAFGVAESAPGSGVFAKYEPITSVSSGYLRLTVPAGAKSAKLSITASTEATAMDLRCAVKLVRVDGAATNLHTYACAPEDKAMNTFRNFPIVNAGDLITFNLYLTGSPDSVSWLSWSVEFFGGSS